MRVVTFGAGYVGLVTSACLCELGHVVLCVDNDAARIHALDTGDVPICEPGLSDLIERHRRCGRLSFSSEVPGTFDEADIYFVCVGTPPGPDGAADVSAVNAVSDAIARAARKSALVAIKSTVPVGTCDAVQTRISSASHGVELEVVSNPEFMKEGDAVADFFKPDRIVLGARSKVAGAKLRALYAPLRLSEDRVVMTDPRSSELTKYAANTMLAMRVSFMNELARLCHATGANINAVRAGVGADSRIGGKYLDPGPGYGGSCLPKDVQALSAYGKANGVTMRLAEASHIANLEQADFLAALVSEALAGVADRRIAFWGLAFKPETDDVREAPSLKLAERLLAQGATVVGHDPLAGAKFGRALGGRVEIVEGHYDALTGAHALVLLTDWSIYRAPDFVEVRRRLLALAHAPLVVDARNMWRPREVTAAGLRYQGIGVVDDAHTGGHVRAAQLGGEADAPCAGS